MLFLAILSGTAKNDFDVEGLHLPLLLFQLNCDDLCGMLKPQLKFRSSVFMKKNDCRVNGKVLSIGDVARRSGVTVSALHFYERKGLIKSRRSAGNHRVFHREVLRRVAIIKVAQRIDQLSRLRDYLDGCIGCGCLSVEQCPLRNPDDELGHRGSGAQFVQPV